MSTLHRRAMSRYALLVVAAGMCFPAALGAAGAGGTRSAAPLKVLWRSTVDAESLQPYLATSANALLISGGQSVTVLDPTSGRSVGHFRAKPGESLSSPTIVGENLAVVSAGRSIYGIDIKGRQLWRYPFGESVLRNEFVPGQAPVVLPDGRVFAPGPDGKVHALEASSGKKRWTATVGSYRGLSPAIALGVSSGLLLLDASSSTGGPPQLVAVDVNGRAGTVRFAVNLGVDVSSFVAGGAFGIVAASYRETRSRRGANVIVALDLEGRQRWKIDRGRHEVVLAITPGGKLATTSQDAEGDDPGSLVEFWKPDGRHASSVYVAGTIQHALVGRDESIYLVSCRDSAASILRVNAGQIETRLDLGAGCMTTATMDESGRLFAIRPLPRLGVTAVTAEVVSVRTPSASVAELGWRVPRGNPRGTAFFIP